MMTSARTYRRVIVGYDPTPTGHNALWWAVEYTARHHAVLFVVRIVPSPRPLPQRPLPPVDTARLQTPTHTEIADALLLATGDKATELDIRVAVLHGHPVRTLTRLADRSNDLLILSPSPRPLWLTLRRKHPPRAVAGATTLLTTDPTTAPTKL